VKVERLPADADSVDPGVADGALVEGYVRTVPVAD
jgi:hypothetical protein